MAWGGIISGLLYIGATLTLLVAVGKNDISVLQGIVQAVSHMAARVGVVWIVTPFAVMLESLNRGDWIGLDGRIGADSIRSWTGFLLPSWLGKVHPTYRTPYAALIVQAIVSLILIVINFYASGGVQEAFPDHAVAGGGAATGAILICVRALLKFA